MLTSYAQTSLKATCRTELASLRERSEGCAGQRVDAPPESWLHSDANTLADYDRAKLEDALAGSKGAARQSMRCARNSHRSGNARRIRASSCCSVCKTGASAPKQRHPAAGPLLEGPSAVRVTASYRRSQETRLYCRVFFVVPSMCACSEPLDQGPMGDGQAATP